MHMVQCDRKFTELVTRAVEVTNGIGYDLLDRCLCQDAGTIAFVQPALDSSLLLHGTLHKRLPIDSLVLFAPFLLLSFPFPEQDLRKGITESKRDEVQASILTPVR